MYQPENSDDFATLSEPSTLKMQRWLTGPIDRVWAYLTDSDLRRKWLAAGDMALAPGAPLELVWRNDDLSDPTDLRPEGFSEEHRMQSHVVSVDPMRQLTIAWGKGEVTFLLEPKGDKVLLTLTHTGLADGPGRIMISAGWHMHVNLLIAELTGDEASSFWRGWAHLKTIYAARLPQ